MRPFSVDLISSGDITGFFLEVIPFLSWRWLRENGKTKKCLSITESIFGRDFGGNQGLFGVEPLEDDEVALCLHLVAVARAVLKHLGHAVDVAKDRSVAEVCAVVDVANDMGLSEVGHVVEVDVVDHANDADVLTLANSF